MSNIPFSSPLPDDKVCCRQQPAPAAALQILGGVPRDRNSKSIIYGILELLFASDIPFRCLHRSVTKQKLNLFELASTAVAEPGARAALMPNAA
jgi:hypothetical protein